MTAFERVLVALHINSRRRFRMASRFVAVCAGAASAYGVGIAVEFHRFYWSTLFFALGIAAAVLEFLLADYFAERQYPADTEKVLEILENRLGRAAVDAVTEKLRRIISSFEACDTNQVSGTVHILIELSPSLEDKARYGLLQLTDYVGPARGSKGRVTTLEKGVIGRCARTAKTAYVNFADVNDYRRRMVLEFGFSHAETEKHTIVAQSYLAEPLTLGRSVIGVLYFFSTEPQVFPHAAARCDLTSKGQDLVDLLKTVSIVSSLT